MPLHDSVPWPELAEPRAIRKHFTCCLKGLRSPQSMLLFSCLAILPGTPGFIDLVLCSKCPFIS